MATATTLSLYEVLGLPMGATGNEIKAAYRRLARTSHPDVVAMSQKDKSGDGFMKIHAAYSTLSDPNKRATYDRDLFRLRRRHATVAGGPSKLRSYTTYSGSRSWETDQCW